MTRPSPAAHDLVVEVDGLPLSGLLAEPASPPDAVVLALPGNAMLGRYFDGPVDPDSSLLALGAARGFTVWALDRPGYGASAGAPDERVDLFGQVDLVHRALDRFGEHHAIGAGAFVVAHSYGLKLALAMAADARGARIIGIDGVGTGYHFLYEHVRGRDGAVRNDRGAPWGPAHFYPDGTFDRGRLPLAPPPPTQGAAEAREWPRVLETIAPRITAPVRFTFGDHERMWPIDDDSLRELRDLFTGSPRVETYIQAGAGHNVSLSHAARAYHERALDHAAECVADAHGGSGSSGGTR
jgi:pimeloyl-ACP methyl ester carboxylesterase